MKRKLIRQGQGGHTIYVPAKWTKDNKLKAGSEVDVVLSGRRIVIDPLNSHNVKKRINLVFEEKDSATEIEIKIVNAFWAGYDIISILYKGDYSIIETIAQEKLVGFECSQKEGKILLEGITTPSSEDITRMVTQMFQMTSEIINEFPKSKRLKQETTRVQRYDNYIKSCISRGVVNTPDTFQLWKLTSDLAHIARWFVHWQKHLKKNWAKQDQEALSAVKEMFEAIKKAYYKKKVTELKLVHTINNKYFKKKTYKNEDSMSSYYSLGLLRMLYYAAVTLTGYIYAQEMLEK